MLVESPAQTGSTVGREASTAAPASTRRPDLYALGLYLLGGLWLTAHLWRHPNHRMLTTHPPDQLQFEFWLAHAARVLTHGDNPFFIHQLNAPDGVNMMANTSTLALTLPLAPVTMLFGPGVAFGLMVLLAPVGTALGWYGLFSRRLTGHWPTALLGGAFCGFAPGIVSQDSAHPNIAAQFMVPLIIWQVSRLAYTRHRIRDGVLLGLAVTYQMFLNQEIVLITALGCLVFFGYWAASRWIGLRTRAVTFLTALAIGTVTALVLLAYPLWYQFFGPRHYDGLGPRAYEFGTDLASFTPYSSFSLSGDAGAVDLATSAAEENTFLGAALLGVAVLAAVLLWRRLVVRATVTTALVLTVLSTGAYLRFDGRYLCACGPLAPVRDVPIISSMIPTRMALALIPAIAVLLVLLMDWVRDHVQAPAPLRRTAIVAALAALLPLIPLPYAVVDRPAVPRFFSAGTWRGYVPDGRAVVSIPIANNVNMAPMQWAAAQGLDFAIAGGYFLGPDPDTTVGRFDAPFRPTSNLWDMVARTGTRPVLSADDRSAARADLRYWHAAIVVLTPGQPYGGQLKDFTTDLLGTPPTWSDGVWFWDVRTLGS